MESKAVLISSLRFTQDSIDGYLILILAFKDRKVVLIALNLWKLNPIDVDLRLKLPPVSNQPLTAARLVSPL